MASALPDAGVHAFTYKLTWNCRQGCADRVRIFPCQFVCVETLLSPGLKLRKMCLILAQRRSEVTMCNPHHVTRYTKRALVASCVHQGLTHWGGSDKMWSQQNFQVNLQPA